jgi:putative protease
MKVTSLQVHRPELLAPAGDWDCLRAAVANGADAVYFGLREFNARHRATNFDPDELPAITEYLHHHNVRGFVTLNTLIFSDELPVVVDLVHRLAAARVDAVIVQDLGLMRLVHKLYPTLPIHASTQTTQTEARGIDRLREFGVQRVIIARELSVRDIASIRARTTMPLEVFIHGALCVAYSGQCLTSEALGGRSANRGQCAQACRMPYDLIVDNRPYQLEDAKYLLSPLDLAGYEQIRALTDLGVASFKIEGRLKGPAYVAQTVQTYRRAIDLAVAGQDFRISDDELRDLTQVYSRGFAPGFLGGVNHQQLVEGRFPKNRGIRVGRVVSAKQGRIQVSLDGKAKVHPGDGVVFDEGRPEEDEPGGRIFSVRPIHATLVEVYLDPKSLSRQPTVGSVVWKTDDPRLRRRLEMSYRGDRLWHEIPIRARVKADVGGSLIVRFEAKGIVAERHWPGPVPAAQKRPTARHDLLGQLGRLGGTPFRLTTIDFDSADHVIIPVSILNRLRRELVADLFDRLRPKYGVGDPGALEVLRNSVSLMPQSSSQSNRFARPSLHVLVRTEEQLQAAIDERPDSIICEFEDTRRYRTALEKIRRVGIGAGLATLRITKPGEEGFHHVVAAAQPDFVLIRSLAALCVFRDHYPEIPCVADFSLNMANEITADWFLKNGCGRFVPSYDLNWEQFASLVRRIDPARVEAVVHQRMPMFHNEHCLFAAVLSQGKDHRDCGRPCDRHRVELQDRHGARFPVRADAGCRNTVYNSVPQSAAEYLPRMMTLGIRHFRVELLDETFGLTRELLALYRRVLGGEQDGRDVWRRLRALNQLGVTRGTLQLVEPVAR